jgi:acetyltransferase-like isoleucine patch superfamily enzyme
MIRKLKFVWGFLVLYVVNNCVAKVPSRRFRLMVYRRYYTIAEGVNILLGLKIKSLKGIHIDVISNINGNVLLDTRGGDIYIGKYVDIGYESIIWTLEHDPQSSNFKTKGGDVVVEDYVWIASRVTILPGVRIGKGAVVASGSVVTKNLEPYGIYGGVPARKIGMRETNQHPRNKYRTFFQ